MLTFLNTKPRIGRGTQTCTAQLHHVYSESSSSFRMPFSGKGGTPLGQTSPCLCTGTYFFNFSQSCSLRSFTVLLVLLSMFVVHVSVDIDVNARGQKFLLCSLVGVCLFIPILGGKSCGLSSGQNLVLFVSACRLLRIGNMRLFGPAVRLTPRGGGRARSLYATPPSL